MPTINYIYHGNQYLCETDENDTPTKLYVNEPGTYTNLVSQKDLATGKKSYPLYDAVGSTRAVTDGNGDVNDTFVYDAWGNVLDRTGTTDIPFQYVGQHGYYRDEETSAYYVMARTYDPSNARWTNADPIELHNGINVFFYVNNNPINASDPSGLITIKAVSEDPNPLEKYEQCPDFGGKKIYIAWDFIIDSINARTGVQGAPCDGFMVQKIDITCKFNKCEDCSPEIPKTPDYTYYEAWFVPKGKMKPLDEPNEKGEVFGYTDRSSQTISAGHCGYRRATGEVRFFCMNRKDVGDLRKIWKQDQYYGQDTGVGACWSVPGLHSTGELPKFWNRPDDGPEKRHLESFFICCPCEPEKVTISASPRLES